jgi:hypothetical protein
MEVTGHLNPPAALAPGNGTYNCPLPPPLCVVNFMYLAFAPARRIADVGVVCVSR